MDDLRILRKGHMSLVWVLFEVRVTQKPFILTYFNRITDVHCYTGHLDFSDMFANIPGDILMNMKGLTCQATIKKWTDL